MQEEEKHISSTDDTDDTKKKKGKSILETIREIDEKEAQREAEEEARIRAIRAERERREKEEYAKKIQQERIELIRLKQGVITESDTIHEEKEEKPKLPFWKKVGNFFYHNKWWLGITTALVVIFTFLIVDYFSKVKPDLIVMLLTDDAELQSDTTALEAYLEQFTDDENGDGKIQVDIYPIPVTDNIGENDYYTGDATKLSTQMMMADSVMVITDAKANRYIYADETLEDLETAFPGHKNIRGNGYYLRHTDFATKIGYPATWIVTCPSGCANRSRPTTARKRCRKTTTSLPRCWSALWQIWTTRRNRRIFRRKPQRQRPRCHNERSTRNAANRKSSSLL